MPVAGQTRESNEIKIWDTNRREAFSDQARATKKELDFSNSETNCSSSTDPRPVPKIKLAIFP